MNSGLTFKMMIYILFLFHLKKFGNQYGRHKTVVHNQSNV